MTVQATSPPTVTSIPGPFVYDQNFLSLMSQEGWGCGDNSPPPPPPPPPLSLTICSYSGDLVHLIYPSPCCSLAKVTQAIGLPELHIHGEPMTPRAAIRLRDSHDDGAAVEGHRESRCRGLVFSALLTKFLLLRLTPAATSVMLPNSGQ